MERSLSLDRGHALSGSSISKRMILPWWNEEDILKWQIPITGKTESGHKMLLRKAHEVKLFQSTFHYVGRHFTSFFLSIFNRFIYHSFSFSVFISLYFCFFLCLPFISFYIYFRSSFFFLCPFCLRIFISLMLFCLSLFLFRYHFLLCLVYLSFLFTSFFLSSVMNCNQCKIKKNALGKHSPVFFKFYFAFPNLLAYDCMKQALASRQHDRSVNQERWLKFMQRWWYKNDNGDWRVRPVYFCSLLFSSSCLSIARR